MALITVTFCETCGCEIIYDKSQACHICGAALCHDCMCEECDELKGEAENG